MDQDPNTAGGTDTENLATREPSQDTPTFTDTTPTTPPAADVMPQVSQPQISRPVESRHITSDLHLPSDSARKRTKTLLAVAVGVLVLLLSGFAVWFFAFYNHPEKVMLDGINHVLRASNVSLEGGGSLLLREGKDGGSIESVLLNFNSSSSKLPNATDVSLLIDFTEDKSLNLKLGTAVMSDGVIYLKISGIMESLSTMGLDADIESEMEEIFSALETIDDEWWRISVRDVFKDMTGDEEIAGLYGDIYDCALGLNTNDNAKALAELYKQHRFVKVEPTKKIDTDDGYFNYQPAPWHNLYEISLDRNLLADFANALPETKMAEELYTCYNTALQQYDPSAELLSAEDIDEVSADDFDIPTELHLFAEISQFGHQIRTISAYVDNDTWQNSFSVLLNYRNSEVVAPSEYRDITELFQELPIEDAWWSMTLSSDNDCYDNDCYYSEEDIYFNNDSGSSEREIEEMEWEL